MSGQEEMRVVIRSIRGQLKESMKYPVEAILVSIDHRTQGTQAKIAEVTDDFLETLETARHEFKRLLVEEEAWGTGKFSEYPITDAQVKRGSCQRTGTGADP